MPIMKVRGVGGVGVIKDLPPFDLPPEAWSDANNVRFNAKRVEKMGGWFPVLTEDRPHDGPLAITSRNNTNDLIYGTPTGLFRVSGRQHINISQLVEPNPGEEKVPYIYKASPDSTWYYTTLSNALVMNTPRENPQGLRPYDQTFIDLPGWGRPYSKVPGVEKDWKAGAIRSFKNYLVALNMTESGYTMPQRVRWSNVAYVNELPPDWYEDDEARDGGFNDLTDANGRVIDGVPLRDSFVIYTDKETYLMEYVGGIMVFSFKKLFSDSGIIGPECAVEFEQKHFVVSHDDIFVHNGSSKQPVASGRVKQFLIDEISSVNPWATKVFAYSPRKEIWITYVPPGNKVAEDYPDKTLEWACTRAAIWNWEYDTWSFYDIPPSFDTNLAPAPDLTTPEWEDFSKIPYDQGGEDYWDSKKWEKYPWSELGKDFLKNIIYSAGYDQCLYTIDVGDVFTRFDPRLRTAKDRPIVSELKRYHLDMDELVENTRSHKMIKHITPQFRGDGNVWCYVGGSQNSTEEPTWDNTQIFDIGEDVKVDAFSNNRYPAIKFMDFGKGGWSLQGYDIDFVVEGTR